MYNLEDPFVSYFIGLLQTDGHHSESSRNRGRVSIEISTKDEDIISKIVPMLKCNFSVKERTRKTNFSDGRDYKSICLNIFDWSFRIWIKKYVPVGKKSSIIEPPSEGFSENDYWRGVIDGDGSLGITARGFPFISLVTDSDKLAQKYISFLKTVTNKDKSVKRNKRDHVYNICLFIEDAQKLVRQLYYDGCLCINRKMEQSKKVLQWTRPEGMVIIESQKDWDENQNSFILSHSISESVEFLNRTKNSVGMRLWRLRSGKNTI
jgi:hypothetical protein